MRFNIAITTGPDVPAVTSKEANLESNRAETMRTVHGIIHVAHTMYRQWREDLRDPAKKPEPGA